MDTFQNIINHPNFIAAGNKAAAAFRPVTNIILAIDVCNLLSKPHVFAGSMARYFACSKQPVPVPKSTWEQVLQWLKESISIWRIMVSLLALFAFSVSVHCLSLFWTVYGNKITNLLHRGKSNDTEFSDLIVYEVSKNWLSRETITNATFEQKGASRTRLIDELTGYGAMVQAKSRSTFEKMKTGIFASGVESGTPLL
jgi:hypothetical protein